MAAGDSTSWFHVGDPTVLGWFTLVAYLSAAVLSWRASRVCRWGAFAMQPSDPQEAGRRRRLTAWWIGIAILLILLGINKELDLLQRLVRVWGKAVALDQGWYENRKALQRTFVASLMVLTAAIAGVVLHWLREVWRRIAPAMAGIALIVSYALLRAALFNAIPASHHGLVATSMWVVEIAGIILVIWAAVRGPRPGGAGAR
jgi:hypothetical protein